VLGLKIGRWTLRIARNKDVHKRDYTRLVAQLRLHPDCCSNARTMALLENWAIACLVGDAIERKLRRKRQSGGPRDRQRAAGVLAYLATSWEQHDARIEVARLGARDLVEANWSSIKAVAEKLLRKQALDAAAVKAIVLRCDREMDSS
jgi:hypothetical protein